jgi:PIN domain nuclease of toxin-antitoxin system
VPDVLDASATLAWLNSEAGAETVEPLLRGAVVSVVNWSEVLQKVAADGRDPQETTDLLEAFGVGVVGATRGDATLAARFWEHRTPLSLADRFCLATAYRLGARAVTADRAFSAMHSGIEVLVIR